MPIQPLPKKKPPEKIKPMSTKRALIFAFIFFGGMIGSVLVIRYLNTHAFREEHRIEAQAALQLFCEFSTNLDDAHCVEYAMQNLNADASRIVDVYFCGETFNPVSETEHFGICIARDGIPLP